MTCDRIASPYHWALRFPAHGLVTVFNRSLLSTPTASVFINRNSPRSDCPIVPRITTPVTMPALRCVCSAADASTVRPVKPAAVPPVPARPLARSAVSMAAPVAAAGALAAGPAWAEAVNSTAVEAASAAADSAAASTYAAAVSAASAVSDAAGPGLSVFAEYPILTSAGILLGVGGMVLALTSRKPGPQVASTPAAAAYEALGADDRTILVDVRPGTSIKPEGVVNLKALGRKPINVPFAEVSDAHHHHGNGGGLPGGHAPACASMHAHDRMGQLPGMVVGGGAAAGAASG